MQYIEKRIAKNKEKEGYKPLKDKLKEKYEAKKGARAEKRIQTIDENKPE